LLIGIDGFRWDYVDRPQAPTFRAIAAAGVRADRMIPSFPSATFPNAYTLVTGLYPAHHGIIGNKMVDSTGLFSALDSASLGDPHWWGGEAIWTTAVKHGRRAIVISWPGSRAAPPGGEPILQREYAGRAPSERRVRQVLRWLDQSGPKHPDLIAMFLRDVDFAGHRHGPDSPQVDSAIAAVDAELAMLIDGIHRQRLDSTVNLVLVADHGMADLDPSRQLFLDELVDPKTLDVREVSPVASILPKPGHEDEVVRALAKAQHLTVYRRDSLPDRWHFGGNARIAPILGVVDEGWMMLGSRPAAASLGGDHGYDPELPSMGALFLATGPAFRRGLRVPPFRNIHVFPLLAQLLEVEAPPSDGSLDSLRSTLIAAATAGSTR
jgi:predicted AlkP superfamily pyrophosphatase or phosphodiesterase